jgi:hypothetical protein
MSSLHAELVARPDSRADLARLTGAWLTEARRTLFPGIDRDLGQAGGASARITVRHQPQMVGGALTSYSARAWRRLLAGLERSYPFHVSLAMMPLGPDGQPVSAGPEAVVAMHRSQRQPRWVRFEAEAPADLVPWAGSPATQRAWADFAKEQAAAAGAEYGHVTDDANIGGTALERAIQGVTAEPPAVPRCREVLRGYSWVTICAARLAARLGGAQALRISGAFDEVTELPGGQVFLRATPVLENYEGAAVRRVFETLAPVLLPGRPDPALADGTPARLVLDADAASYR